MIFPTTKLLCCLQNCMTKNKHESKNIHPCPKIRGHGTQQHVSWISVRGPAEAMARNPVSGVETCRQAVATNRSMCACRFQALENNESGSLKHMEKSDRHSHEIYRCTKKKIQDMPYICIDMPLIHLDVFCFKSLMDCQDFVFFLFKLAKRPRWPK